MSARRGAQDKAVIYAGAWDATRTYDPRIIVTYSGATYMSVARSTAVTPVAGASTPWLPLGGGGGGASLWVGPSAPTDGSVFWYDTDATC